jgi:anti-anti-sigma factor
MIIKIIESEYYNEIIPEGFISIDTMEYFEKTLSSILEKNKNIIINLKKTDFIDSASIGLLIVNLKAVNSKGLKIVFLDLNKSIQQTFTIIGLINSLTIAKSHDEAVAIAAGKNN